MLLGLLLSLLRLSPSDFNFFILQFVFTICFALVLLSFIKYTASNYFVIDANFDSPSPIMSPPVDTVPPCVVCSKATTKHCSACKLVRYW